MANNIIKKISELKPHKKAAPEIPAVEEKKEEYSFKLLFVIVGHGYAGEITEILNENGVYFDTIFQGEGTAGSQFLDLLGLDGDQKDIVMSIVETNTATDLINKIYDGYRSMGIAFTIRLASIGGKKIIKLLKGEFNKNEQQS